MDYPYYHGTLPQEFSGYVLDALSTPEQSHVPDTLSSNGNTLGLSSQLSHSSLAASLSMGPIEDQGSYEEDERLVPSPQRRKEQNRAAQRAFRERKERHVKDIEEKLSSLGKTSHNLRSECERLEHELEKSKAENETLRMKCGILGQQSRLPGDPVAGPVEFTPNDFVARVVPEGYPNPPHRVMICQRTGEKLLDASATWDFIQGHDLFKRGLVDLADVCERLKGKVQCSGQGLVFAEGNVIWVIETSVAKENVS